MDTHMNIGSFLLLPKLPMEPMSWATIGEPQAHQLFYVKYGNTELKENYLGCHQ